MKRPEWWTIAITAYCVWNAHDLAAAWTDAPYEREAWLCLLIWLSPIAAAVFAGKRPQPSTPLLIAALGLALSGAATSVNFIGDTGAAVAAAAWTPRHSRQAVWLPASILWMPVSGWIAHSLDPMPLLALRILLSVAASAWYAAAIVRPHFTEKRIS